MDKSLTDNTAPIGIFDSGVGGLTVLKEILELIPFENIVYFGDVGRTPYGGRSKDIITQFTKQDIAFLNEQKVKFIICACNTSSATALSEIQQDSAVEIIGVIEPGAKAATEKTKNGKIGIIGTLATINSNAYASYIHSIDPKLKVFSLACPLFVPLVEEGYIEKEATYMIARDYLQTMKDVEIDTLVLGCTHYPLLKDVITDIMGDSVTLIDSGEETAKESFRRITTSGLLHPYSSQVPSPAGELKYFVSDVPEKFSSVASRFMGKEVTNITRIDISKY